MTSLVVYHPDTGTYMALEDCFVVEVPESIHDSDELERFLERDLIVVKAEVTVDYCPLLSDSKP